MSVRGGATAQCPRGLSGQVSEWSRPGRDFYEQVTPGPMQREQLVLASSLRLEAQSALTFQFFKNPPNPLLTPNKQTKPPWAGWRCHQEACE